MCLSAQVSFAASVFLVVGDTATTDQCDLWH